MAGLFGSSPRPTGLTAFAQGAPPPTGGFMAGAAPAQPDTTAVLGQVAKAYPGLAKHLGNVAVTYANDPGDGRQLEYYPPWEEDNPNPGKSTVELYNRKLAGDDLNDSVALDMLHYVGTKDPKTSQPVDPDYYALKQQMASAVTAANRGMDRTAYADDVKQYGPQSYEDWLDKNRVDAYVRAYVSPRMNPDWNRPGMFTPEMQAAGDKIKAYLAGTK